MSALMQVTDPSHIMYGSDWPYIHRETVEMQTTNLETFDGFTPETFAAMERESALALFPRFRGA